MRDGNAIIIVIFIIIFVVSVLKKLAQSAAEANKAGAARGGAVQRPDAEASPSEVEDFLRSLQNSRQPGQVQAPPRRPQAQRQARVQVGPQREAPFWQGQPPQPVNEEGPTTTLVQAEAPVRPAAPAVRPTHARRRGCGRLGNHPRDPARCARAGHAPGARG